MEVERITVQLLGLGLGRTEPRAAMRPDDTGLEGNRPLCESISHTTSRAQSARSRSAASLRTHKSVSAFVNLRLYNQSSRK